VVQFGQAHTVNHNNRNNYEPENGGWTVQGGNRFGNAHAVSFHELAENLRNQNSDLGIKIPTGNNIPTVDAGVDVVIPISTPFTLTAIANDADSEDQLTYVWDNLDRGVPQRIPVDNDEQGALFMRLLPTENPVRTIPSMEDVIAGNDQGEQEQLPTRPRLMPIRLTVNDNHKIQYEGETINASGINSDDFVITVADAGPFRVTSQNINGIVYDGGSEQTISWDVNNTDLPPVNTMNVKISLSEDGGFTYPHVLVESTLNNGSATVSMPNEDIPSARIKVEAVGSIYFDINSNDFAIVKDISSASNNNPFFTAKIFPNPANDFLNIEINENLDYAISLYTISGQLLLNTKNKSFLSLENFAEGMYLVKVRDNQSNHQLIKKVVIAR